MGNLPGRGIPRDTRIERLGLIQWGRFLCQRDLQNLIHALDEVDRELVHDRIRDFRQVSDSGVSNNRIFLLRDRRGAS